MVLSGLRMLFNLINVKKKNYNEEICEGYVIAAGNRYSEKLQVLHNGLPFLSNRMKIEKVEKLFVNLQYCVLDKPGTHFYSRVLKFIIMLKKHTHKPNTFFHIPQNTPHNPFSY